MTRLRIAVVNFEKQLSNGQNHLVVPIADSILRG
jgi:hypothetical protein